VPDQDPTFSLADLTLNICTVNRPQHIRVAIESLIEHTPPGPTLQLVLNEASPETWPAIADLVQRWPGPTKVVEINPRVPVDASHQRALEECVTPLINFMGDDDIILGNRFDEAIEIFNRHPNLGVLGTWVQRIGGPPDDPRFLGRMDIGPTSIEAWREMQAGSIPVQYCFPATIYSTQAAKDAGGFEARFGSALDAGISAMVGRTRPALTQTSRLFGFRIHDGSDSSQNFAAQFQSWAYVQACLVALDRGEPEPTLEEWQAAQEDEPAWKKFLFNQNVKSRHSFRRAGAALLDRRFLDFAKFGVKSLAYSPRLFVTKTVEQMGKRQPTG
jgi:hypothetical protein